MGIGIDPEVSAVTTMAPAASRKDFRPQGCHELLVFSDFRSSHFLFRVCHVKNDTAQKIEPLIKNAQFLPNLSEIQAILPTYVIVILTKFHKDRSNIVDSCLCHFFRDSLYK